MDNTLILIVVFAVIGVVVAVIAGRTIRTRQLAPITPKGTPPRWISRRAEDLEPGVQYYELRADFNYNDDKPATSRVTLYSFSQGQNQRQVLSDTMTEATFKQQIQNLRREGWKEASHRSDREGESYYFSRKDN